MKIADSRKNAIILHLKFYNNLESFFIMIKQNYNWGY